MVGDEHVDLVLVEGLFEKVVLVRDILALEFDGLEDHVVHGKLLVLLKVPVDHAPVVENVHELQVLVFVRVELIVVLDDEILEDFVLVHQILLPSATYHKAQRLFADPGHLLERARPRDDVRQHDLVPEIVKADALEPVVVFVLEDVSELLVSLRIS